MIDVDFEIVINNRVITGSIYLPINHNFSAQDIQSMINARAQQTYDATYESADDLPKEATK